jgi:hypothetical protein
MSLVLDKSMRKMFPPEVIFQFFYDADVPGCWTWKGTGQSNGYGMFYPSAARGSKGVRVLAHRFQYEMLYGPIPDGMEIDHLCRNRLCVRPDHLEVVTHRENMLRGDTLPAAQVKQTHCKRGHSLEGENMVIYAGRKRTCRTCTRMLQNGYYAKRKTLARVANTNQGA